MIGGGLAGLAAALELASRRVDVTLLEARPTLGGAVQTLPERDGDPDPPPDNGQHIALGCCTGYLAFLDRIGESGSYRRTPLVLPVVGEDGAVATIAPTPGALLRYRHVPVADRLRIPLVTARCRGVRPRAGETFGALLRRLGASDAAVERFWDVFLRPALNLKVDEADASAGLFTVRTALLGGRRASDLVLPTRPLGEMHGAAAGRTLERAGATVRTGARVVQLDDLATDCCKVVLADGEELQADRVLLAVPAAESARLLGEPEPKLEDSPIVSVHLLFDRRLLRQPLAALLGSPAHWVFDRGALTGRRPPQGQYLTVVSSGAPELLEVRGRGLVDLMAGELTGRLGQAELLWSRVSREPQATFAVRPGSEAHRPGQETGYPNVVRAGAWTATGWPATMEGAVRSGLEAARALRVHEKIAA